MSDSASSFTKQLHTASAVLADLTADTDFARRVDQVIDTTVQLFRQHKPLLVAGNGGSSSDASHIAGELVGRFLLERKALPVIALSADTAILTAYANDYDYSEVFARQVQAYGQNGGMLLAISTSGNSANLLKAIDTAKTLGMSCVGLTGASGGKMREKVDVLLNVPSNHTPRIQEMHIMVYHYLCERIEHAMAD